jgi:hypothetical protein
MGSRAELVLSKKKNLEVQIMQRFLALLLPIVLLALPGIALSEDAQSILDKVRQQQIQRWEGVASYIVDQSIMGNRTAILYERTEVKDAAGNSRTAFRMVPADEIEQRRVASGGAPNLSPQNLKLFAMGAEAQEEFSGIEEFAGMARLVGKERLGGRQAFHIRNEEINRTQATDDGEFTINSISLWIDAEKYVPLKLQMDGIAKSGNETRPIRIEKLDEDYRTVADSNMYESFRQVMRIGGILSAKDQKEMQKAQKGFAKFEKEMQQMPEAQRNMIMRQMGPQMEMMKKMASGGGFEVVTEIHSIRALH